MKVPNEGATSTASKAQVEEELEALKKRGQVRNNDFTKGCVAENSTVLPEDRQRELQLLQDELSNDPHVKELAAKQRRALERKAARARGDYRKYHELLHNSKITQRCRNRHSLPVHSSHVLQTSSNSTFTI